MVKQLVIIIVMMVMLANYHTHIHKNSVNVRDGVDDDHQKAYPTYHNHTTHIINTFPGKRKKEMRKKKKVIGQISNFSIFG